MTERISLTELQLTIRDSLYMALPDFYWVVAEISELKENYAGHCYLELVEKQADEVNVSARAKGIIWNKRYLFLKSFFENSTGEPLREGLKILVKVKIEYHEIYGLSLVITDIDPSFTVGEMTLKRQMIIKKLEEEGVFSMNKELCLPAVPQRIAVISSKNAAGYTDFINHLKGNLPGYIFYTSLTESAMQGSETENGIISALDKVAANFNLFDLVVIIRGGGSQADLSWFDNYNIAYYITQFPLPVITGIGHDKDMSVADMVAYKALKTPTAVADFLIDNMAITENHIAEMSVEIKEISRKIIEENRNRIEACKSTLLPLARLMISDLKNTLTEKITEIVNVGKGYSFRSGIAMANQKSRLCSAVKSFISDKNTIIGKVRLDLIDNTTDLLSRNNIKLEGSEKTLTILSPGNVLRRGYTITSLNGKILKKSDEISINDHIVTMFIDGSVDSTVIEKKVRMGEKEIIRQPDK